jgi:hypothetical protein
MFNKFLYDQIVYLLNSYATDERTIEDVCDLIVLHFPWDWITLLGQGVEAHRVYIFTYKTKQAIIMANTHLKMYQCDMPTDY